MKRFFYLALSVGVIIVLLSVIFKEMHWPGRKQMELTGICVLLVAMVVYLFAGIRKGKQIGD